MGVIFAVCVLIISMCSNKEQFTIKGNVDGFADSTKLYLRDKRSSKIVDSAVVIDGSFRFVGKVERPKPFTIYPEQDMRTRLPIWIENSEIHISGNKKNFKYAKVTGSSLQKQADTLEKMVKSVRSKYRDLTEKIRKLKQNGEVDQSKMSEIGPKLDSLRKKGTSIRLIYISKNPDKIITAYNLEGLMRVLDKSKVDSLYQKFTSDIKSSFYGRKIERYVELSQNLEKGDQAIDFTLANVDSDSLSLSDYRGEYVLLDFWASWCGPCRHFNKRLLKNHKKYQNKDFNILSVSIDKKRKDWIKAVKKDSLNWDNVWAPEGIDSEVSLKYNVKKVPTNYLINPKGKIMAKDLRGKKLDKKLEEIFKNNSDE